MELFMPDRVFFQPSSLKYPLGQKLFNYFKGKNIEIVKTSVSNVSRYISGTNEKEIYARSKKSLVVTTKKGLKLDTCKPSADFEFSLVAGCPGSCEYCYLQTSQVYKPYMRIYVNLEDIFNNIKRYIAENNNKITTFEVASIGDPLSLEHITGSLAKTIEFFGTLENGRLRVVTKYNNVDSLVGIQHEKHTRFRISINSRHVIKNFEHNTASFEQRIEAASKISNAGYPIGFIIAPIMVYTNWKEEYFELFNRLKSQVNMGKSGEPATFELIQHRFTDTSKKIILERFPKTILDMDESKRTLKWGKYGRFKYIYPKETAVEIRKYISSLAKESFPDAKIEYFT